MSSKVESDGRLMKAPEISVNPTVSIQINDSDTVDAGAIVSEPLIQRKFFEKPNQIPDSFEYDRNGTDPGLVLIFNQESFQTGENSRVGSIKDVEELITTFGRLTFNISEEFIYHDLKRGEILQTIDSICSRDLSDRNCLIVIFLTHGHEDEKLYAQDAELHTKEIWEKFATCESLRNKPKLFVFQACKGERQGRPFDSELSPATENPRKGFKLVSSEILSSPLEPDMLLVYAAAEGNAAFRDTARGTWFIQELCRNFQTYGRRDDVVSLLIRTSKCVATYETKEGDAVYKQMPTFVSTLSKRFYLMKSKDRNITLTIKSRQNQILEILEVLKTRVDILYEEREKGKRK